MAKKPAPREHIPRDSIRFKPDAGALGSIDFNLAGDFRPTMTALVAEESHHGCGLIALASKEFVVGMRCRVKIGRGLALKAELRWRIDLNSEAARLGFMYLE